MEIIKEHSTSKMPESNETGEIGLINYLILESMINGADAGGSYDQNEESLINAMGMYLSFTGKENDYDIIYCKCRSDNGGMWCCYQFVKKEGDVV